MTHPSTWEVYLVTDRSLSRGRSTREIVEAAVRGGVSAVQLREKDLDTRSFLEEGRSVREILRASGVPLIINDRIDVALALDADGVHLGLSDMPADIARRLLGPDRIIGLSVEGPEHLTSQETAYADYLAISPVFLTLTKTDLKKAWGLDGLRGARSLTGLPLVAIGSVKHENAKQVTEAGADCVAVVTAITAAENPEQAARLLLEEVRAGKAGRLQSLDT
ncbi:MAG: thiamine phosphate synthase [Desulfomonilaceae bacterium]|nr:thiamine phosphate synthase [Desulfomonilaceae bacterium]